MSRPRYLVSAAIALVLTQAVASPTSTIVRASESCEALREWARPFADRSFTLAQFLAYDVGQQRAIFAAVTPRVRSALWREHLEEAARRPEFTPHQRAAIRQISAALTPEAYAKDSPASYLARELWKRHEQAFDHKQRRVFYRLTGGVPLAQDPWCDCALSSGSWECYPLICGGPQGCWHQPGCGWGGLSECNAKCQ
jgi:hypothetical protein